MPNITIGIDPGCTGAIAVVLDGYKYLAHLNMPTVKVGTKSRVNGAVVASFLGGVIAHGPHDKFHVYIEQVGAMPGQGVSSTFTFGHAAGVVEGVVAALGLPYTMVTPQAWKKRAGLIGLDKDAARSMATKLFPNLRILDQKGKGQAVADAILLACYGDTGAPKRSLL